MGDKFSNYRGGDYDDQKLTEEGWYRVKIDDVLTRNKEGKPLTNKNGKQFWGFRLMAEGGPFHGHTHFDAVYMAAGFRLAFYCEAIDYEPPADDTGNVEPDPRRFVGESVVIYLRMQDNGQYLEVKEPEGSGLPQIMSLERAKDLVSEGTIYVQNLDGQGVDAPAF